MAEQSESGRAFRAAQAPLPGESARDKLSAEPNLELVAQEMRPFREGVRFSKRVRGGILRRLRFLSVLCVLTLVAGPSLVRAASVPTTARHVRNHRAASANNSRARAARTRQFWTRARMRRAASQSGVQPTATEGRVAEFTSSARRFKGYYWQGSSDRPPASTAGRVFAVTRNPRGLSMCSGTSLLSGNQSLVWTAGHCLYDPDYGGWLNRVMFCPGYDNGCQLGKWTWNDEQVTHEWFRHQSLRFDMGAFVVDKLHGQTLMSVTGGQGIAWNQSRLQHWHAFGYPAAPPFDGERLYVCQDRSRYSDNPPPIPGPKTIGIGCDMTPGSSGGGWLIDINRHGYGYVNGVVSYGYRGAKNVLFSPYFGSAARDLFRYEGRR